MIWVSDTAGLGVLQLKYFHLSLDPPPSAFLLLLSTNCPDMPADEWLDFFSDVLGEASRTFYEILRDKKSPQPTHSHV